MIDGLQINKMEKMRNRILEELIIEKLFSNIVIKSRTKNNNKIKEIKDESVLPRYDIPNSQFQIRKKLSDIVKSIIDNHPYGISHGDLAAALKINRKNLTKYIDLLIEKQIIIRNNSVNDGPYIISPIFLNDNRYFLSIFYFRDELHQALNISEDIGFEKVDEIKYSQEKGMEERLFEFSNTIGSTFTYLCLFAMDPVNDIAKTAKTDEEKDLLIMLWVHDMISKFCLDWLEKFASIMYQHEIINNNESLQKDCLDIIYDLMSFDVQKLPDSIKEVIDSKNKKDLEIWRNLRSQRKTKYVYNSEVIGKFQNILKNVYPNIYNECDDAKSRIYKKQENKKAKDDNHICSNLTYKEYQDKTAKKCEHNKSLEPLGLFGQAGLSDPVNNPYKYPFARHCRQCHKDLKVRESLISWYDRIGVYKEYQEKSASICKHSLFEPTHNPYEHPYIRHCKKCHKNFYKE